MEQLIERINKLNTAAKAGIIFAIIGLVVGGTWFFLISDLQDRIDGLKAEQKQRQGVLAQKQEIADNLNDRRRDLDKLEDDFRTALTHLPLTKDLDELLARLNDIGKKSGLQITRVTPQNETQEGFIARIPISMQINGNYHEIAVFLQEISNLTRIVNASNLKLTGPQRRGETVFLNAEFMATTFRFVDSPAPKGGKK